MFWVDAVTVNAMVPCGVTMVAITTCQRRFDYNRAGRVDGAKVSWGQHVAGAAIGTLCATIEAHLISA
jgi:hypothetical protein